MNPNLPMEQPLLRRQAIGSTHRAFTLLDGGISGLWLQSSGSAAFFAALLQGGGRGAWLRGVRYYRVSDGGARRLGLSDSKLSWEDLDFMVLGLKVCSVVM